MKNQYLFSLITTSLSLLLFCVVVDLKAQSPQGIPYQAVVRNVDGSVMSNASVNMNFKIHDGSASGNVVYEESHALTSNAQGLVSCVVGNGVVSQGNFGNVQWGSGAKFLQVLMGNTDLGTQQMMSVPYALYAGACEISVSEIGDTLYSGNGNFVIVPGISDANYSSTEVLFVQGDGVTDIDGTVYPTIIINGQEWMQQNLAVSRYRNGEPISTGLSNSIWQNITSGAYAIYNNDLANNATYGKLYNWYAVSDSRGLCPSGWHVPSDAEWTSFVEGLGGPLVGGGRMKSIELWAIPNIGASNDSEFNGVPAGYRSISGAFNSIGSSNFLWSGSQSSDLQAWDRLLSYSNSNLILGDSDKNNGFSVRCIKD